MEKHQLQEQLKNLETRINAKSDSYYQLKRQHSRASLQLIDMRDKDIQMRMDHQRQVATLMDQLAAAKAQVSSCIEERATLEQRLT